MRCAPKAAFAVALACLLALPGLGLAAKKKADVPETPVIEEKAAQVLDKACKALGALKSYTFRADLTVDKVYQDGSKIQAGRVMDVSVLRPGAFRIATAGDDIQASSVFDGKTFTLSLPDKKVYGQLAAAMDTDALMDMLAATYGIESPLGDLLSNDTCSKLKGVAGYYVGKSKVRGTVCEHLFFQGKDVDWQIWVEDGPSALPRKIVITEKKLRSSPQFTAVLSGWKTGESSLDAFGFTAPADFTRDDAVITGAKSGK
ncbi:MAG: hypothetical protein FD177_672 [Desulfovibrionaceae bacterium]|nr:MAG: hypothetical protein FD177_672 [Desulfovibrionaceae bacterium]